MTSAPVPFAAAYAGGTRAGPVRYRRRGIRHIDAGARRGTRDRRDGQQGKSGDTDAVLHYGYRQDSHPKNRARPAHPQEKIPRGQARNGQSDARTDAAAFASYFDRDAGQIENQAFADNWRHGQMEKPGGKVSRSPLQPGDQTFQHRGRRWKSSTSGKPGETGRHEMSASRMPRRTRPKGRSRNPGHTARAMGRTR